MDFLKQGSSFYMKNKLKSEIFNDKKIFKQEYFPGTVGQAWTVCKCKKQLSEK